MANTVRIHTAFYGKTANIAASKQHTRRGPINRVCKVSCNWTSQGKLYLLSTGQDPGSTCELDGWIKSGTDFHGIWKRDWPVATNYRDSIDGPALLAECNSESKFSPLPISVELSEDGNGIGGSRTHLANYTFDPNLSGVDTSGNWQTWTFNNVRSGYQCKVDVRFAQS